MSRCVPDKWLKTAVLRRNPRIAAFIPETCRFSTGNLREMLARYGRVVAKPCIGAGGLGVVMIGKHGKEYTYHFRGKVSRVGSFGALMRVLNGIRRRRAYLLQRGIQLATIAGSPVDYRVKVVDNGGRWRITVIVARMARAGLFVTNLCRGGKQLRAVEALRRSLPGSPEVKRRQMRVLTYRCTAELVRAFPGIGQLGFDYGIDRNGRIWIFEVNTRPQ